jgi:DNA/RNA endonuclease G (NUC1)
MRKHGAWLVAVIIALIWPLSEEAHSARNCTSAERASADRVLWLNRRDKEEAIKRHLPFGVPQSTVAANGEQLLVQRDYVIEYDNDLLVPLWTAHHIEGQALGSTPRVNCFRRDIRIEAPGASLPSDYNEPLFDQGHMTPNADMSASLNATVNSFILSNMVPQYCQFNRGIWQIFESIVRLWAAERRSIYVITGSIFDRDGNRKRDADDRARRMKSRNGKSRVAVPSHFYKIVFSIRPDSVVESISLMMSHNQKDLAGDKAIQYLATRITSIGRIEAIAGAKLLPDARSRILQARRLWSYTGRPNRSLVDDRCRATAGADR